MKNTDVEIRLDNGEGQFNMEDRIVEQLVFDGLLYECSDCGNEQTGLVVLHTSVDLTAEQVLDSLSKVSF
jgi:hypothetical protein